MKRDRQPCPFGVRLGNLESLRYKCVFLICLCCSSGFVPAQEAGEKSSRFPYAEKLSYRIEWHLITAGNATVDMKHNTPDDWQTNLHLESAGVVTKLYRVLDSYQASTDDKFCGINSVLDAEEGKRHTITHLSFQKLTHKVTYDAHDLVSNATVKKDLEVPLCTHEITGALEALRETNLPAGKSAFLPITDGKKIASVKVEGQAREAINLQGKTYQTIRYEAFVFDNILYRRHGRLLIWISDDGDRVPVQLRLQLGFPIGNVTVQLEKQQKS